MNGPSAPRIEALSVAVCHEWLTTYGGSEQVAQRIGDALGARDVYTTTARQNLADRLFPQTDVKVTSRWGDNRLLREHWQWFLPFMPIWWRSVDLTSYDLVFTSSHATVNAVRVPPGTPHLCYCHTPMRYAWDWRSEIERFPLPMRRLWPPVAALLRRADRRWAQRVTLFVANSEHVADRIRRYYGRDAVVVYPPIDTDFWTPGDEARNDYFLFAGRLVPYKRPDIAVRAATEAGVALVVAGAGPEAPRLKRLAGPRVRFVDSPSGEELRRLYRSARAFVFPGVEDFGMTLVEAQSCGTPVLALKRGGAMEAVVDGVTGHLYERDEVAALAEEMIGFDPGAYRSEDLRKHALGFSVSRFESEIRRLVEEVLTGRASDQR